MCELNHAVSSFTSSGGMCHSAGTLLAKANHLWFSVYTAMARGAPGCGSKATFNADKFKRSATVAATTANTNIT